MSAADDLEKRVLTLEINQELMQRQLDLLFPKPSKESLMVLHADKEFVDLEKAVAGTGIPWAVIIQWIKTYGLPVLMQILPLILPLLMGKVTLQQAEAWIVAAAKALQAGQPLPPLPTPAP